MPSLRHLKPQKVHTFTGSFDSDRDSGIDVSGSTTRALPVTHSTADYYSAFSGYLNPFPKIPSITLSPSQPPPSYYDIQGRSSLRLTRIPVLPREEEGKEQLPQYYCSLHREAVFYTKMEMRSPFERATDRSWNKEYVVLHGTLLRIHKPRRIPFFATPEMRSGLGEDGSVRPEGWMPGELLKSYTLQGAEVGIATDYKKRHFVIRVRAETEQFLLSLKNVDEFIAWLEALSAAVDLSLALEERTLPRYQTIPRRRRRNGRQVVEEQERIIRSQFPNMVDGVTEEEEDEGRSRRDSTSTTDRDEMIRFSRFRGMRARHASQESVTEQDLRELSSDFESSAAQAQPHPEIVTSPSSSSSASHVTSATSSNSSASSSPRRRRETSRPPSIHRTNPEPSTEEADGKWRPSSSLTHEANLRYARRCMAVLCEDTPRQSDFIIKDGKRYRVLWEKKILVIENSPYDNKSNYWSTVELPHYEDLAEESPVVIVQSGMRSAASSSRASVTRRVSPWLGTGQSISRPILRPDTADGRQSDAI